MLLRNKMGKVTWLLIAVCVYSNIVYARQASEIFTQASKSVVIVNAYDEQSNLKNTGSGVVVGQGEILTNCHILQDSTYNRITSRDKTYDSTLIYADKKNDLCLLVAPEVKNPVVKVGKASSLKVGSQVYAIGSPQGLELSLSEGLVSQLRGDKSVPLIQTTAPLSFGSSGGGLFDNDGKLVGITSFQIADGQNLNFAIPIDLQKNLRSNLHLINNLDISETEDKSNKQKLNNLPDLLICYKTDNDGGYSLYIKPNTIKKIGVADVRAWVVFDYKSTQRIGEIDFKSTGVITSFDCKERSYSFINFTYYSDNLTNGEMLSSIKVSSKNREHRYVLPNSAYEAVLNNVCELSK